MFGSVKVNQKKMIVFSLSALLVFFGVCLMMLRAGAPDTVRIGDTAYPLKVENDAEIEAFLDACGCPAQGLVSDRTVTVPKTWNDTYTAYEALQRDQGLTLAPFKGKEARELVYAVRDADDYVAVLVAEGRIIAAHRCAMQPGSKTRRMIP